MSKTYPAIVSGLSLCAIVTGASLLGGCGAKDAGTPAAEVPVKTETPAAPVEAPAAPDFSATLQKISACEDMFAWYSVREAYLAGTERGAEVDAALAAKEAELVVKTPAKALHETLDLVAFDWKLEGSDSAEGKPENFNMRWLFHVKAPIVLPADEDIQLVLRGWPDKAHQNYLEGIGQADNKYFEISFWLKPRIVESEAGSYYLVERKTYKEVPNVPYRMHTFFSQLKKKEDGGWGFVARFGASIDMGWFADTGK